MAQYDDLHTGTITLVGVISAILTFVIILAAQVLYYQYRTVEQTRKEIDVPIAKSDNILEGQRDLLNSFRWIDREKGVVGIPIDQAMQQVLSTMTPASESPADAAN